MGKSQKWFFKKFLLMQSIEVVIPSKKSKLVLRNIKTKAILLFAEVSQKYPNFSCVVQTSILNFISFVEESIKAAKI